MGDIAPTVDPAELLAEQARVLYGVGRQTAWSNSLGALIVAGVVWPTAPAPAVLLWCGLILANVTARLTSFWFYRRAGGATRENAPRWAACYALLSLIVGLTWGIGLAYFLRHVTPPQEVMVMITATATVAGGVATSVLFWAHVAYNVGTMLPIALAYALRGQDYDAVLACAVLAFIALTVGMARTVGGSIVRGLRLGMENAALVQVLGAARAEAEAANLAKSQFLANMGHELRTPLNAVLGFSELMRDGTPSAEQAVRWQGFARDIHDSGERLLEIINDVLDMARLEAGRYRLRESKVDMAELLQGCLAAVQEQALANDVAVHVALPQLPPIQADARAVRQVLLNLLTNAVKFTPGGGSVAVTGAVDARGLSISVRDTGIGIDPQHQALVFEPFRQVDMETNRRYSGTGLGLPISKQLVELHGGELRLESAVGEGTTVRVRFPAERLLALSGDGRR